MNLLILFLALLPIAGASCPFGCACGQTVIICSCQNTGHRNLTLGPFYTVEYITKIYVHSCEKIRIPTDGFAGLAISLELSIKDVGRVEFEEFAFREMHKYPDQIQFMNTGISEIPNNTFSGLNNVKHLWFRNVTIGRIHTGGFRLVSNVEYLYFRETTIKTIYPGAFELMTQIQNLYFRKDIKIDSMGDHIFRESQIGETVFEDAHIGKMNLYALSGGERMGKMILVDCVIPTTSYEKPKLPFRPTKFGQELQMMKVNFSELSLGPFSNWRTIRFEYSRIEELIPSSSALSNVTTLHFLRTLVNYITERAMERTFNVETIAFEECAIDTIYSNAFAGADKISTLMFLNTRFIRFMPHAFSNLSLASFILEESELETIMHNAMSHLQASTAIKIVNTKVKKGIHKHAFKNSETDYFGLEYCDIQKLESFALEGLSAQLTNISVNSIYNQSGLSLVGVTTSQFLFTHNRFPCSCTSDFGSLFELLESGTTPGWFADRNLCLVTESHQMITTTRFRAACNEDNIQTPNFKIGYGVTCKSKLITADCECLEETNLRGRIDMQTMQRNFPKQISILTISGCNHLEITSDSFFGLNILTRLRIQAQVLDIASRAFEGLRNLRFLELESKNLDLLRTQAFNGLQNLDQILIKNSNIKQIHSGAFANVNTDYVVVENSVIKTVAEDYIDKKSTIGNLTFHLCDIQVMGSLLGQGRVENVSLVRNTVESILAFRGERSQKETIEYRNDDTNLSNGYSSQPNLCATSNEVICYCQNSGFEKILEMNQCGETVENFCVTPDEKRREEAITFLASQNINGGSSKTLQSKHCKGSLLPGFTAGFNSAPVLKNTFVLNFLLSCAPFFAAAVRLRL